MTIKALSLNQFCEAYGISRSYYYKLKEQNKAPATYNLGKKIYISIESAETWHETMQA